MLCLHLAQGSRFKVQGSGLRWRLRRLFYWAMPESDIQDTGYSHNDDTSSPLEKGRAKGAGWICPAGASFYVANNALLSGIISHAWHEILRLSPHLFWLGFFSHRAFSSAQDDDTRGRKGSHLGDALRVVELAV